MVFWFVAGHNLSNGARESPARTPLFYLYRYYSYVANDWNFDAKFSVSPNNITKGPLCNQTQSMIVLRYGVFKSHSMGFAVFEFAIMDHARMQVPVPVLEQQNEGDHESLTFFQAPILQIFSDPSRFLYTTATSEQQSDGYDRFVGANSFALIDRSPDE
ncbi:hypothetical protein C8R42DRAFT_636969 [Lentinula raphanica]|nr:hypothetical protein C8R42DRAFT_636969 [Lentinula raphanica]